MKEIVEYIIAFAIIVSIIPFYNMLVYVYYKPTVRQAQASILDVYASAVASVLQSYFDAGNLTPELPEIYNSMLSSIASIVGPTIFNTYGFNATIYSGIVDISVSGSSVSVSTLYNGTLILLPIYQDKTWGVVAKNTPDSYNPPYYIYRITLNNPPTAIVAVLESGAARFINYWLQDTYRTGYLISTQGSINIVVNRSVLSSIQPFNHPNFSTVYNTTLFYYAGLSFGNYNSSYYEPLIWVVFRGYIDTVTINRSSIGYFSAQAGAWNSTYSILRVFLGESHITVNLTCQWTGGSYSCGNPVYVASWATTRSITLPISNLVLVELYDSNSLIPIPVYRGPLSIGEKPPRTGFYETSFYIRLGSFDYIVDLKVWQK
ncbi:hypothetical protein ACSU1N_00730 [Thermogladius sp. 4427co]|uniref:hypothetical protein n=1 Tax=Thermogladius sp. 4427co TaxID=3450718 RepID=UPI003F7A9124